MTKIEKQIIAVIALLFILIGTMVSSMVSEIEKAGGVKQVIIEAGKEIKEISKDIDKAN